MNFRKISVNPVQLTSLVPFITFAMFGGFLGWQGMVKVMWEFLPILSGLHFPGVVTQVGASFTAISILAPVLRWITAGISEKYIITDTRIGELGVEDLPVAIVLYVIFIGYALLSSYFPADPITLTPFNAVVGFIGVIGLLSYNAVPYYTDDIYPDDSVLTPLDGGLVIGIMLSVALVFTAIQAYTIAIVQSLML